MVAVTRVPSPGRERSAHPRVVTLTVHGIGVPDRALEVGEAGTWITVDAFEAVLDVVASRPHVRLTFDDANASDVEVALPRLRERGLTADFFVLAGLLGERGRLDHDDVRELHGAGMRVGSHGWAHRNWREVAAPRAPARLLHEELVLAPQVLARVVGTDVTEVAVPFGQYDRHVLSRLRRAGAGRVFTSDGGWSRPGAWVQPRNSIHSDSDPAWAERLTARRPALPRRVRTVAAQAAKRTRGSGGPLR